MDFKTYQGCYKGMLCLIVSMLLISSPGSIKNAYGDRQSDLEDEFDIVDTFDGLRNWQGGTGVHYDSGIMPKKQDGTISIWSYYANDATAVDDWIKDHGEEYRLGSAGKSLCMNYNNRVGGSFFGNTGYGPSRIGTYFGSGDSTVGYKKIHIFFMVKFRSGFFSITAGTNYADVGVVEFISVLTGFAAIGTWGNGSDRAVACSPTSLDINGMQGTSFNFYGGRTNNPSFLFLRQSSWKAKEEGCYIKETFEPGKDLDESGFSTRFESLYSNDKWIGIELIVDIGTLDNPNASTEVYLYDIAGTQVGHFYHNNYNQLVYFDHKINKIIIGGKRYGTLYNQQDAGDSYENRFYVDDFIVHGSRIGPTYFSVVSGKPPTISTPENLRKIE